jgi:hypothetical protein
VVIDQIKVCRVALLEAKNDPPVGANRDAPITREIALERVQSPARQVELARLCRLIEPSQHARDFVSVLRVQFAAVVAFIEASEAPVAKPPNHPGI